MPVGLLSTAGSASKRGAVLALHLHVTMTQMQAINNDNMIIKKAFSAWGHTGTRAVLIVQQHAARHTCRACCYLSLRVRKEGRS